VDSTKRDGCRQPSTKWPKNETTKFDCHLSE